jgi:diphthamide biosynthesis methyltransferase
MGFKKSWDVSDISRQIHSLARECTTPYNDGFTAFECKKDLHQLKQIIDNALAEAPDFGDLEQQWLQEQEKKRIIKLLKS